MFCRVSLPSLPFLPFLSCVSSYFLLLSSLSFFLFFERALDMSSSVNVALMNGAAHHMDLMFSNPLDPPDVVATRFVSFFPLLSSLSPPPLSPLPSPLSPLPSPLSPLPSPLSPLPSPLSPLPSPLSPLPSPLSPLPSPLPSPLSPQCLANLYLFLFFFSCFSLIRLVEKGHIQTWIQQAIVKKQNINL